MFFIKHGNDCVCFPELDSSHMEANQIVPMRLVYVGRENNDTICAVADDTDIYLS